MCQLLLRQVGQMTCLVLNLKKKKKEFKLWNSDSRQITATDDVSVFQCFGRLPADLQRAKHTANTVTR